MATMLELDGRTLEGGGQILRTAICLSALTGKSLKITNIRGNRSGGGGLKKQHLTGLAWLAGACQAETKGAVVKSKEVEFVPGVGSKDPIFTPLRRNHFLDIGSPGAITLVFQAVLPFLLFSPLSHPAHHNDSTGLGERDMPSSPLTVTIQGGSNVSNSPSIDYIQQVLLPMLAKCGLPSISAKVNNRGWSSGGTQLGSVTFAVTPMQYGTRFPSFNLRDRGGLISLRATILAPRSAEKDFRKEVKQQLKSSFPDIKDIEINFEATGFDAQTYLLVVATTSNGYKLGCDELYGGGDPRSSRRGAKAMNLSAVVSKMTSRVIDALVREVQHGGCVDEFMRDQLVVFAALAHGVSTIDGGEESKTAMSLHAKTVWWVVGQMLSVTRDESATIDQCLGSSFTVGFSKAENIRQRPTDADLPEPRLLT